jgi:hypothetical protein
MTSVPPDPDDWMHYAYEEDPMTSLEPAPDPVPIAPKVKWAALAGALGSAVLAVIISAMNGGDIISGVPDWVPTVLLTIVGGLAPGIAGYAAPHQPRPEDSDSTG